MNLFLIVANTELSPFCSLLIKFIMATYHKKELLFRKVKYNNELKENHFYFLRHFLKHLEILKDQ